MQTQIFKNGGSNVLFGTEKERECALGIMHLMITVGTATTQVEKER